MNRLRIEYHGRNAWATIRTPAGTYVCTVNRNDGSGSNPTKRQIADWRRRVRAVRDPLERGESNASGPESRHGAPNGAA